MNLLKSMKKGLALIAAAGLLCSMPGMSVLADTEGPGAVKPTQEQEAGPGASNGSVIRVIVEDDTQTPAPAETQPEQSAPAAEQPAGEPISISYSGFFRGHGWGDAKADNQPVQAPASSWLTAIKANITNLPEGVTDGIIYQVNLSGSGWLDWNGNGEQVGNTAGEMPLEAMRMELTGALQNQYDLYYKVLQNGSWTEWAVNGAVAGQEGVGLRIDGFRVAAVVKGSEAPADTIVGAGIDPSRPMIALTFDDGPRTSVTSRILDSLQANGSRATFFMLGSKVNSNAGVIKRMAEQGCEVANHTHDHKYISKLNAAGICSQISSTNSKIQAICGVSPVLMRPPGGYYDAASLAVLAQMGMPAIMWSIDTRDWQHRNSQKTIDTVLSQVKDGDIILMHDIYDPTADAAEALIPKLTEMGYQLVTVSELASYRGGMSGGHTYSQFRP